MKIISVRLAGSTKCKGQDFIRSKKDNGRFLQPENIYLVRDPQNPVDANAVQVWYDDNGEKVRLGFVQRERAAEVAYCLDQGNRVQIIHCNVCGSEDTNFGLHFTVEAQPQKSLELLTNNKQIRVRNFNDVYAEFLKNRNTEKQPK